MNWGSLLGGLIGAGKDVGSEYIRSQKEEDIASKSAKEATKASNQKWFYIGGAIITIGVIALLWFGFRAKKG
jgi:hypothetical protein